MASSFAAQIPTIVHLVQKLKPASILDIGKGFGKYGFLFHEYVGIENSKKIQFDKTMREQSNIKIDAVEIDQDLMLPHLPHFYSQIYFEDILVLYPKLPRYDLIFMADIIEHIEKKRAIQMLLHFLSLGSKIIISTPVNYFEQNLYESEYEHHISHWSKKDFEKLGFVEVQKIDDGAIYLLSKEKIDVRGFGSTFIKKIRRIARAIKNEI